MSSRIVCCASEGFFNILIPTKLGRTELQEYEPREATVRLMLSTKSRPSSSGTFSKDSQRCSSVKNQRSSEVYVEGINPAPHIHEQMATTNYVQMATTLRTPLRITTSRLSTMR